jgi:hypothetical protein
MPPGGAIPVCTFHPEPRSGAQSIQALGRRGARDHGTVERTHRASGNPVDGEASLGLQRFKGATLVGARATPPESTMQTGLVMSMTCERGLAPDVARRRRSLRPRARFLVRRCEDIEKHGEHASSCRAVRAKCRRALRQFAKRVRRVARRPMFWSPGATKRKRPVLEHHAHHRPSPLCVSRHARSSHTRGRLSILAACRTAVPCLESWTC